MTLKLLDVATIYPSLRLIPVVFNLSATLFVTSNLILLAVYEISVFVVYVDGILSTVVLILVTVEFMLSAF
jgi:hypothetical protein